MTVATLASLGYSQRPPLFLRECVQRRLSRSAEIKARCSCSWGRLQPPRFQCGRVHEFSRTCCSAPVTIEPRSGWMHACTERQKTENGGSSPDGWLVGRGEVTQ